MAPQADRSTDLVGFFHPAEQLKAATDAAYGENDLRGRAQYENYRHLLRNEPGDVERVISTDGGRGFGKCCATCAALGTGSAPLRRHSADCRLGLALTLRGWAQSGRFSAPWPLLSKTYRTEVLVPDDDIESAPGRAV